MKVDSIIKLFGIIAVIFFGFFCTLFITVPIVQSIWKMLVYPSYQVELKEGVILFTSLTFGLLKFSIRKEDRNKSISEVFAEALIFYVYVLTVWVFAYLYTFFI